MKIAHLTINESRGGAAIAAQRLHRGMVQAGLDSHMLVLRKSSADERVHPIAMNRLQKYLHRRLMRLEGPKPDHYPRYSGAEWSTGWATMPITPRLRRLKPDIVNLHWINAGYLSIEMLPWIEQPIVWTLHDMWAITGGCHYDENCGKYQVGCGECPILASLDMGDLSRATWARKQKHWAGQQITLVTPSHWLADCVRASNLLWQARVEVIPNGLDMDTYKPYDRNSTREHFNLPKDKKLILFGAFNLEDPRKGIEHLVKALKQLKTRDAEIVFFGGGDDDLPDINFTMHDVGVLNEAQEIAQLYSAVDVFVAPSLQDNLPNTVMESLACGTPVVAFNIGGMPDMITHQENGYLAEPFRANDFAKGIDWVLADAARYQALSEQARQQTVERFSLPHIAKRYQALYETIRAP